MSDITIPGVNSKYGTDKLIEGLMDAERIPLRRLEDQKKTFSEQKKVWQEMKLTLTKFKDSSKALFGYQNPFQEHIAESSDEVVLTASAGRDANNEIINIKVNQIAGSDRFLSSSLTTDYRVPDGTYSFSIGEKEVSFRFRENRLQTFIQAVNKRSNGLLKARLINDTSDSVILILESTKTGSSNKIIFKDDSVDFGISTGLIKPVYSNERSIDLSDKGTLFSQSVLNQDLFQISENKLTIEPESKVKIPFSPSAELDKDFTLNYTVRIVNLDKETYVPPEKPPGPAIESSVKVNFEGITIDSAPSSVTLPEWNVPPPPVIKESLEVIFLNDNIPLPPLKNTTSEQQFSIPYSTTGKNISSIDIDNINTHRKIIINDINISNPNSREGYAAVNPADTARNVELEIDGIPVSRETNTIDDLITGVTLNINKESDQEVQIEVKPDKDSIKDGIISFVGYYNQVLQNIQILTSRDENVIGELEYLTPEEKTDAKANLGIFQGDMTFQQLKNRMQRIAMEAYTTSAGRDLSMLSQIGISTNSGGFGGGVNRAKLRGYLEINENTLDEALSGDIKPIKELFGRDTDGDLIIDSGSAYEMDRYINSYTQIGGLIATRLAGIDGQVTRTDSNILDMERKLDDKEMELRIKFGRMEGALKSMEQSSRAIENFSSNN